MNKYCFNNWSLWNIKKQRKEDSRRLFGKHHVPDAAGCHWASDKCQKKSGNFFNSGTDSCSKRSVESCHSLLCTKFAVVSLYTWNKIQCPYQDHHPSESCPGTPLSPAHIICPPCWPVFQPCRSPCVCWTYLDSTSCVGPLPGLCSLLGMFFSHMAVQLASFLSGLCSKAAPAPSDTSLLGSLLCSLALQSTYHALALKSSARLVIIWLLTLECNDSTLCLLSAPRALCIKSILLAFHKKWQAWGQ